MQRMTEQAQEKAGHLTEKAKEQTTSFLDSQRERLADAMDSAATALRQSSHQLQGQDRGAMAQYGFSAADNMHRASDYLRRTDTDAMLHSVEGYARREPALFLGGALALGFLGARFLKSSRRADQQQSGRFPTGYRGGPSMTGFAGGPPRSEEAS